MALNWHKAISRPTGSDRVTLLAVAHRRESGAIRLRKPRQERDLRRRKTRHAVDGAITFYSTALVTSLPPTARTWAALSSELIAHIAPFDAAVTDTEIDVFAFHTACSLAVRARSTE